MYPARLRVSLRLHQRRVRNIRARLEKAKRTGQHDLVVERRRRLRDEEKIVEKRNRQIAAARAAKRRPPIITAAQLGLTFQDVFGAKGPVYRGAGHYTAGPRARDAAALKNEMLNDHAYHKSKGWGGLSYETMIADDGTIGFGNPMNRKAAAVALNNTGMVGICVPGTTGDRMTDAQKRSIRWLLDNWHTNKVPSAHRLPRPARELDWRPHRSWPSQSTACPGEMIQDYKELIR